MECNVVHIRYSPRLRKEVARQNATRNWGHGMHASAFRHGCLIIVTAIVFGATVVAADDAIRVQTRVFDIDYSVNTEALPLESVQLWYTLDRGQSWHLYGYDDDRVSPMSFNAPNEGLYGFVVVATNPTGPSSSPPTRSMRPHLWVFVDFTPPIVQIHRPTVTEVAGVRVVQLRWTAVDGNLGARPVELRYRRLPETEWHEVAPDMMANTGRFDWRIPAAVSGPVVFQVIVTDKGLHRSVGETAPVEVPGQSSRDDRPSDEGLVPPGKLRQGVSESTSAKAAADRLFQEALADMARGNARAGIARLREVVSLDPSRVDAFTQMGRMLYGEKDFESALGSFELALGLEPTLREALRGAAMVDRRFKRHASAEARLQKIIRGDPNDAQTYLDLGDVSVFRGDVLKAREYYTMAATVLPEAGEIVADARQRLSLLDLASQRTKASNE